MPNVTFVTFFFEGFPYPQLAMAHDDDATDATVF